MNIKPQDVFNNVPIAGQSLTSTKAASYRNPPRFDTNEDVLKNFYKQYGLQGDKRANLVRLMVRGYPLEDMAKILLFKEIASRNISIFHYTALIEPVLLILWYIARKADITPVIYDRKNDILTEDEIKQFLAGGSE